MSDMRMRAILWATATVFLAQGCGGDTAVCGDGVGGGSEACDGSVLGGATCDSRGFATGTLACKADCTFDESDCAGVASDCGDGQATGVEECDRGDVKGETCTTLGYLSGALACKADCTFNFQSCVPPTCNDNNAQGYEECDGSDLRNQDCTDFGFNAGVLACNNECKLDDSSCFDSTCGDGVAEGSEACDDTDFAGATCLSAGFEIGSLACTAGCELNTFGCSGDSSVCGDGVVNGPEECEGLDLKGETCQSQGFDSGFLLCVACRLNTGACWGGGAVCGDNVAEGNELCDGADLAGKTCTDFGFSGGTLGCFLCAYSFFDCSSTAVCGDNVAEIVEVCDGTDLRGQSCFSLGFGAGALGCNPSCFLFDYSNCADAPVCGNNTAEVLETCDGTDLRGRTCEYIGLGTGNLACDPGCLALDYAGCSAPPVCGNGTIEGLEVCDDTEVRGLDCQGLGLGSGTLACNTTCTSYDVSGCSAAPTCGDNSRAGLEVCDGADLAGYTTCEAFGYGAGTVGCMSTCGRHDLSGCAAHPDCGNTYAGFLTGKQCDAGYLGLQSCETLGFSGGTLGCNATNCTFDVSTCQ